MKESGSEIRDSWQSLLMICHPGWGCTWLYGCGSSSSLSAGFWPAYIIQCILSIHIYLKKYICNIYTYTYWYLQTYTHLQQAGACQPPPRKTWGPGKWREQSTSNQEQTPLLPMRPRFGRDSASPLFWCWKSGPDFKHAAMPTAPALRQPCRHHELRA